MVWLFGAVPIALTMLLLTSSCGRQTDRAASSQTSERGSGATPLNLAGRPVDPFQRATGRTLVLLFVSTECPISNRYVPEMRRLRSDFDERGVQFWLVYPNADETAVSIEKHRDDFALREFEALRDPAHWLVKKAGATVTPEAAVFTAQGQMVYRGRIDNRYVDFGKERPSPTQRDLADVLEALVQGKPVRTHTQSAIGCYITQWFQ